MRRWQDVTRTKASFPKRSCLTWLLLDFSRPGEPTVPFHSGYAKRKSFAHERELRACIFISEEDTLPGAYVRVDLDAPIDEVFVAPESEPWIREVVEGVMNTYGLPKRVVRSPLYEDAIW